MDNNEQKPEKGKILISAPLLTDFFKRSVIYLTEHNENGSVGFIINKRLNVKLSKVLDNFPEFDAPVMIGGPVQTELINFIHRCGDILDGGIEIENKIYWGGNFEQLKNLIAEGKVFPEDFRFFLGYSGWSPDQLENELNSNSWIVTEGFEDYVFTDDYMDLWSKSLRDLGGKYAIISTFPDDPTVN